LYFPTYLSEFTTRICEERLLIALFGWIGREALSSCRRLSKNMIAVAIGGRGQRVWQRRSDARASTTQPTPPPEERWRRTEGSACGPGDPHYVCKGIRSSAYEEEAPFWRMTGVLACHQPSGASNGTVFGIY
jgi:hypothetical protein